MKNQIPVSSILENIRRETPLIHNITNYVVMNWTANALLAAGASPVMAHATEEAEEMTLLARTLVVNIGTLSPSWIDAMRISMTTARAVGKPVVFDPVGAGATQFRTKTCEELLTRAAPTIIRGNASEIAVLAGAAANSTKGVDSTMRAEAAVEAGRALSVQLDSVVCVSGPTDFVLTGTRAFRVENGHPLMSRVTGMGCAATALIAAAASVHDNPVEATVAGMTIAGIAGELAARKCAGPGSFQVQFLDELAVLGSEEIERMARITAL